MPKSQTVLSGFFFGKVIGKCLSANRQGFRGTRPEDYNFYLVSFYETGKEEFKFLKDVKNEF
jgi:hypothetical protein